MSKSLNKTKFISNVSISKTLLKLLVNIQKKYKANKQLEALLKLEEFKKFIISCEKKISFNNKKALIL